MSQPSLPPGPQALPVFGHFFDFIRNPFAFLEDCARQYGDIVTISPPGGRAYLLNRADLVSQMLSTGVRETRRLRQIQLLSAAIGNGVFTAEGDAWLRQRRMIQPSLMRERIPLYISTMVECADTLAHQWQEGQSVSLLREMTLLTQDVIMKSMFSTEIGAEGRELAQDVNTVMTSFTERFNSLVTVPTWVPIPRNLRFRAAMRRINSYIYTLLKRRRKEGSDHGDFVSMLLQARDEDGSQLSDAQIRDELITMFFAGHETGAITLTWAWHLVMSHPEIEARLLEELESVLGGRLPTLADLPNLPLLDGAVKEALRLYPPAWFFGRTLLKDVALAEYNISAGQELWCSPWLLHRDPRYFDAPLEFRPERWEGDLERRLPRGSYIPFGMGPRICPGKQFAMVEAELLLATLLPRWRLVLESEGPVVPEVGLSLRPVGGLRVRLERRSPGSRKSPRASQASAAALQCPFAGSTLA